MNNGQSWFAGRVAGVPIHLHWSLGVMVAIQLLQTLFHSPGFLLWAALAQLLIVGSIFFHELAHATFARAYGLHCLEITLHAFGGWARMSGQSTDKQQVVISAVGPLSNFALWMAFSALARIPALGMLGYVAYMVASFNLLLGLFNLIPAYPLDGGSVLRHGLLLIAPPAQANWLAFKIGGFIAVPLGIFGLYANNLLLALVGFMSYQYAQERLTGVGHVGGWEYWKARVSAPRRSRPSNVTPINVNWQKYAPPGTTVREPSDKPPTIN